MISLTLFLVVAAVICWIIAAFGGNSPRFNLVAAGLALFGIAYLLGAIGPIAN